MEQWATETPRSAMIETSFGESQVQWAATTRSLRKPMESRYSTGLLPLLFSKLSTSDLVSERWMWRRRSCCSAISCVFRRVSSEQVYTAWGPTAGTIRSSFFQRLTKGSTPSIWSGLMSKTTSARKARSPISFVASAVSSMK
jgi:hypothetical protein